MKVNIKATVKRNLHSEAIGPDRLIAVEGEEITITDIYAPPDGPHAFVGRKGRQCVPRSWLVECGALEPLDSDRRA